MLTQLGVPVVDKCLELLRLENTATELVPRLLDYMGVNFHLFPKIGIELEFYVTPRSGLGKDVKRVREIIEEKTSFILSEERGNRQYEASIPFDRDILNLINGVNQYKQDVAGIMMGEKCDNVLHPLPFVNDHGSAMHVNVTLHKGMACVYKEGESVRENSYISRSVAGILHFLQEGMALIAKNDSSFLRFAHSKDAMSPKNVSWGINNRSTAIRLVNNTAFNSRRLEFRVPSINDPIESSIIFLLLSICYGLDNKLIPPDPIYGNAHDEIFKLPSFPKSMRAAKTVFSSKGNLSRYYLKTKEWSDIKESSSNTCV